MHTRKFMSTARLALLALLGLALPTTAFADETRDYSVTIAAISTDMTLKLPDGRTTRAPVAPGAYAIVKNGTAIFEAGKPAPTGLEPLAEDGKAESFIAALQSIAGVKTAGMFIPGQPFTVAAAPGERLVFAAMFVQSNDLFLATPPSGIVLPGTPQDVTTDVKLWDAGTERNEPPGVGPNQAPRQAAANTGPAEGGNVQPVNDGFVYPSVDQVIKVTIAAK